MERARELRMNRVNENEADKVREQRWKEKMAEEERLRESDIKAV